MRFRFDHIRNLRFCQIVYAIENTSILVAFIIYLIPYKARKVQI